MFVGFYAVSNLPLATATTLEYTTPLFMLAYIVVLARIAYAADRVRDDRRIRGCGRAVATDAGYRPDAGILRWTCSGALAGVVYVLIRRLTEAGEPASRIVLWYSLSGAIVAGAMVPFGPPSDYNAQTVVALGALSIVGLARKFP